MTLRNKISIRLWLSHIVLPIVLVSASLWGINCDFLFLAITQTVLCIAYFAGYWEFFGLQFRQLFLGLLELLLVAIFIHKLLGGFRGNVNSYLLFLLSGIQIYLLIGLAKIFIVILKRDYLFLDIEFPFKNGTYLITDGGNSSISRLMNYHYYSPVHRKKKTNKSMLYATDIVKIDPFKHSWLPRKNEEYPIFGENVYSPLEGQVIQVENSIPDNEPFSENFPYNTGNTVVIRKDNFYFLLGHLKQGSIVVNAGDMVHVNDLIGCAGNSGWTERPHIHIQLIKSDSLQFWSGIGVEVRYRNKILYKNLIIRR